MKAAFLLVFGLSIDVLSWWSAARLLASCTRCNMREKPYFPGADLAADAMTKEDAMYADRAGADSRWKGLFNTAGVAAIVMLILILAQSAVFFVFPPPSTVEGYFSLFQRNWLVGLLDLDLIYLVITALMIPIYLALYVALRRANESAATIAIAISLVSTAVYFTSRTSFEMLSLSRQYAHATTDAQRSIFLSAGQAALATYSGTGFDVYYILSAIALLLFSVIMLQSNVFGRVLSYMGIISGVLMLVPSTAGTVGLIFAFGSLIPWVIWLVLFARRLLLPRYREGPGV